MPAQCRRLEPGLNADMPLHAGISLPQDEVGNCRQFAHLLQGAGAAPAARTSCSSSEVLALTPGSQAAELLGARPGRQRDTAPRAADFDAVVLCAGTRRSALLEPLGLTLPLAPVYGYSVTAPLQHARGIPRRWARARP